MSVFQDYNVWNDARERELYSLYDQTGIRVCEFCFAGELSGSLMVKDRDMADKAVAMYIKALEICNKLGAITEMEYEYKSQNPVPLFEPYKKMDSAEQERFDAVFKTIGSHASENGWLLLEPVNRYESPYLNSMEDNARVITHYNLPHAGLLADIFHLSIEEADLYASPEKYLSLIKHVHLGDNNRLMPGNGNIDWKRVFSILNKGGYSGFASLECGFKSSDKAEELQAQARYLRSLIR